MERQNLQDLRSRKWGSVFYSIFFNRAMPSMTRLDYCQFLLSNQINYMLTGFANHAHKQSHDTTKCYLCSDKVSPRLLWGNGQTELVPHTGGYLPFDGIVLDKRYSREVEPARRQWSGNAKQVIEGIGRVTCVYGKPELDRIECAILVWVRLKSVAEELGTAIYALKRDLLSDAMVQQLHNPSIQLTIAIISNFSMISISKGRRLRIEDQ